MDIDEGLKRNPILFFIFFMSKYKKLLRSVDDWIEKKVTKIFLHKWRNVGSEVRGKEGEW